MRQAFIIGAVALVVALAGCNREGRKGDEMAPVQATGRVSSRNHDVTRPPVAKPVDDIARLRPAMLDASRMLSAMPPERRARVIEQIKCMGKEAVAAGTTPAPRTGEVVERASLRSEDPASRTACHKALARPQVPAAADSTVAAAVNRPAG